MTKANGNYLQGHKAHLLLDFFREIPQNASTLESITNSTSSPNDRQSLNFQREVK
jgi:hypothetical protein